MAGSSAVGQSKTLRSSNCISGREVKNNSRCPAAQRELRWIIRHLGSGIVWGVLPDPASALRRDLRPSTARRGGGTRLKQKYKKSASGPDTARAPLYENSFFYLTSCPHPTQPTVRFLNLNASERSSMKIHMRPNGSASEIRSTPR